MKMKNVKSGFKVCGIYPYSREAVIKPEAATAFRPGKLPQLPGLKFIPMYRPARNESSVQINASTSCRIDGSCSLGNLQSS